jgi:hypothetical protein
MGPHPTEKQPKTKAKPDKGKENRTLETETDQQAIKPLPPKKNSKKQEARSLRSSQESKLVKQASKQASKQKPRPSAIPKQNTGPFPCWLSRQTRKARALHTKHTRMQAKVPSLSKTQAGVDPKCNA